MEVSDIKKRFIERLGLDINNLPDSFNKKFETYMSNISKEEMDFLFSDRDSKRFMLPFCIKDVIGTDHINYRNKPIIEAFLKTKRGDIIVKNFFSNPNYYFEGLKQADQSDLHHDTLLEINRLSDGSCFIIGGNNRILLLIMLYLSEMEKAVSEEEKEIINKKYTFYGAVKSLPKDKEIAYAIDIIKENNKGVKFTFLGENPDDIHYKIDFIDKSIEVKSSKELKDLVKEVYKIDNLSSSSELFIALERLTIDYADAKYCNKESKMSLFKSFCPDIDKTFDLLSSLRRFINYNSAYFDNIDLSSINYSNLNNVLETILGKIQIDNFSIRLRNIKNKKELEYIFSLEYPESIEETYPDFKNLKLYYEYVKDKLPDDIDCFSYDELYNLIIEEYIKVKEEEFDIIITKSNSLEQEKEDINVKINILQNEAFFKNIQSSVNRLYEQIEIACDDIAKLEDMNTKVEDYTEDLNSRLSDFEKQNSILKFFKRKDKKTILSNIDSNERTIKSNKEEIKLINNDIGNYDDRIAYYEKILSDAIGKKITITKFREMLEYLRKNRISIEDLSMELIDINNRIAILNANNYEEELNMFIENHSNIKRSN